MQVTSKLFSHFHHLQMMKSAFEKKLTHENGIPAHIAGGCSCETSICSGCSPGFQAVSATPRSHSQANSLTRCPRCARHMCCVLLLAAPKELGLTPEVPPFTVSLRVILFSSLLSWLRGILSQAAPRCGPGVSCLRRGREIPTHCLGHSVSRAAAGLQVSPASAALGLSTSETCR